MDDREKIQAAIGRVPPGGGWLDLPPGAYVLQGPLVLPPGVGLRGVRVTGYRGGISVTEVPELKEE